MILFQQFLSVDLLLPGSFFSISLQLLLASMPIGFTYFKIILVHQPMRSILQRAQNMSTVIFASYIGRDSTTYYCKELAIA